VAHSDRLDQELCLIAIRVIAAISVLHRPQHPPNTRHTQPENVRAKRLEWGAPRLAEHLAEVLHAQAEAQRAHGRAEPAVFRPSPAGLDLLRRMLEIDPAQRITAEDALRHDYFTAEAPLPGPNALVCGGVQVASYPRRNRTQVPGPAAGTGAAAAGGAAATALAPSAAAAPVAVAGAYDGAGAPALLAASQPALPPQPHHAPLAMAQQYLPVAGAVSAALPMASTGVGLGLSMGMGGVAGMAPMGAAPLQLGVTQPALSGAPQGLGLHPGPPLGSLPTWAPQAQQLQQPPAALYQQQYAPSAAAPSAPLVLRAPIGLPPTAYGPSGAGSSQRSGGGGQQQGRRGSRTESRYNPY
jgi:hypothetical protein